MFLIPSCQVESHHCLSQNTAAVTRTLLLSIQICPSRHSSVFKILDDLIHTTAMVTTLGSTFLLPYNMCQRFSERACWNMKHLHGRSASNYPLWRKMQVFCRNIHEMSFITSTNMNCHLLCPRKAKSDRQPNQKQCLT